MYQARGAAAQVDVISAFSTDGRIAALDLAVLDDDRRAIPPYDAVVLASARLAREQPEVLAALRPLAGAIDADTMRRLNAAVDQDGESAGAVARAFLERRNAPADAQPRAVSARSVAVVGTSRSRGERRREDEALARRPRRPPARPTPARRAAARPPRPRRASRASSDAAA